VAIDERPTTTIRNAQRTPKVSRLQNQAIRSLRCGAGKGRSLGRGAHAGSGSSFVSSNAQTLRNRHWTVVHLSALLEMSHESNRPRIRSRGISLGDQPVCRPDLGREEIGRQRRHGSITRTSVRPLSRGECKFQPRAPSSRRRSTSRRGAGLSSSTTCRAGPRCLTEVISRPWRNRSSSSPTFERSSGRCADKPKA
jgi:hypothetical protein